MATEKKTKKTAAKKSTTNAVDTVAAAPVAAAAPRAVDKPVTVKAEPTAQPARVEPVVAAKAAPVAAVKAEPARVVSTPAPTGPVAVVIEQSSDNVTARIRYAGALKDQDRVLAHVGVETFGGPRWQLVREVTLQKTAQGAHEAVVQLGGTDLRGASLAALQLAFASQDHARWDSAGVPYGYYQVSAQDGRVYAVPQQR